MIFDIGHLYYFKFEVIESNQIYNKGDFIELNLFYDSLENMERFCNENNLKIAYYKKIR